MSFITDPTSSFWVPKIDGRNRPNVYTSQEWLSAGDLNQVRTALFDLRDSIRTMADLNPSHGEIYVHHEIGAQMTATMLNVYMPFAPFTVSGSITSSQLLTGAIDPNGNTVPVLLSGGFVIGASGTGVYQVNMGVSFNVDVASLWEGAVFVNNTESAKLAMYVDAPNANQIVTMHINGMQVLSASDMIDIRAKWKQGGSSQVLVDINSYNFSINKVFTC